MVSSDANLDEGLSLLDGNNDVQSRNMRLVSNRPHGNTNFESAATRIIYFKHVSIQIHQITVTGFVHHPQQGFTGL